LLAYLLKLQWYGELLSNSSSNRKLTCQRDRATLRVIEYFAKSLTQGHSEGVCKSLLVFHWNCVCISYRFWDIQHQRMAWPWNRG